MKTEASGRIIDTFAARDLRPSDKPILQDDMGQYSADTRYAMKLRRLRHKGPDNESKDNL